MCSWILSLWGIHHYYFRSSVPNFQCIYLFFSPSSITVSPPRDCRLSTNSIQWSLSILVYILHMFKRWIEGSFYILHLFMRFCLKCHDHQLTKYKDIYGILWCQRINTNSYPITIFVMLNLRGCKRTWFSVIFFGIIYYLCNDIKMY